SCSGNSSSASASIRISDRDRSCTRGSCCSSHSYSGWACSVAEAMADPEEIPGGGWRRVVGRIVGALILLCALAAAIVAFWQWENRPETDDATVRANFIGIAPKVSGYIVDLPIHDNQMVTKGDLLFAIDPRPYEIALERARAALALTRKEVDALGKAVSTAEAGGMEAGAQVAAPAARRRRPH